MLYLFKDFKKFLLIFGIIFLFILTNLNIFAQQGTYIDLEILSSSNFSSIYSNQNISFYAILTNKSGNIVNNANCSLSFPDNVNLLSQNLIFNGANYTTSLKFDFIGDLNYNILCSVESLEFNETINSTSTVENILPDSNLDIFDDFGLGNRIFRNKNIVFYANYTSLIQRPELNLNISSPINPSLIPTTLCQINFPDFSLFNLTMDFNLSSNLFEYKTNFSNTGQYEYFISCKSEQTLNFTSPEIVFEISPIFQDSNLQLPGGRFSSTAIYDLDNDGFFEIIITGSDPLNFSIFTYRDNQLFLSNFSYSQVIPLHSGSLALSDLNNNGFADLIMCGANQNEPAVNTAKTFIYLNNGSAFELSDIFLTDLQFCSISVVDLNLNGKLEIIISGTQNSDDLGTFSGIYNNFSLIPESFTPIYYSSLYSFFLENSSFPSLLSSGLVGPSSFNVLNSIISANFSEENFLINSSRTQIGSLVLDNSNRESLVLHGQQIDGNRGSSFFNIYRQENGSFSLYQSLTPISEGSLSIGDIDNNGRSDIFATGFRQDNSRDTLFYSFDLGSNLFVFENETLSSNYAFSSSVLFDLNQNGALDLLISGFSNTGPSTKVYYNTLPQINLINQPPTAPNQINVLYNNITGFLEINWSGASDDLTPQNALTYALSVGTISNPNSILSGLPIITSNPSSGFRGNMMYRTAHKLNISDGSYVIRVRTIDSGLRKSSWMTFDYFGNCNYLSGDWVITGNCELSDDIILDENATINISQNASLRLINSSLTFQGSENKINNFGELIFDNVELIFDNLVFNHNSSVFEVYSSEIEYNQSLIYNSILNFQKSNFSGETIINNSTLTAIDNIFLNNLSLFNSTGFLTDNTIFNLIYNNSYIEFYNYLNLFSQNSPLTLEFISNQNTSQNISMSSQNTKITLMSSLINNSNLLNFSPYTLIAQKPLYFTKNLTFNLVEIENLNISLNFTQIPDYNKFKNSITTNFTQLGLDNNLSNITNAVIGIENLSKIIFTNSIDFRSQNLSSFNLSNLIDLTKNYIFVNVSVEPRLNTSANLTFFNLSYSSTPIILRNGQYCGASCFNISYTQPQLNFSVNSFSNYSLISNSKINWIDENLVCNLANNESIITISYTSFNNSPINNASCEITINGSTTLMENLNQSFFRYNSTLSSGFFNFTISCDEISQDFDPQNLSGSLFVRETLNDLNLIPKNTSIPNLGFTSSVSNDEFLLITGEKEGTTINELFLFDITQGNLTPLSTTSFTPIRNGAVLFFDINNNGFTDIVLSGRTSVGSLDFSYYLNSGNNENFIDRNIGSSILGTSLSAGDIDNDGFIDILLCGQDTGNSISRIYLNNQGSFDSTNYIELPIQAKEGTCLFYDYNQNGIKDIIINGRLDNNTLITKVLHTNLNGSSIEFENITDILIPTSFSSFALGDISGNSFFDIIVDGQTNPSVSSSTISNLYTFDPLLSSFTLNKSFQGNSRGTNKFLSLTNLNLFSLGANDTLVLANNRNINLYFSPNQVIFSNKLSDGSVSTFDLNSNSVQDLLISGVRGPNQYYTKIYQNTANACIVNTPPQTPLITELNFSKTQGLFINWTTVPKNTGEQITYNIRIGSFSSVNEFYSGVLQASSKPAQSFTGNMGFRTNFTLRNFNQQCYIVQVQAVNSNGQVSPWSETQTYSSQEIAGSGFDEDCDGVSSQSSTSQGTASSSNTRVISPQQPVIPPREEIRPEEPNEDNSNTQPPIQEDQQIDSDNTPDNIDNTAQNTEASNSAETLQPYKVTTQESIEKIFNLIFNHQRTARIENGKTIVVERIYNKFFYEVENISVIIDIPREIIPSASQNINAKTSTPFKIIQDNPIIEFKIDKIPPQSNYYITYELDREVLITALEDISINFTYNSVEDKIKEFENLINKTQEKISINTTFQIDEDKNETRFNLDLDFKGEAVLYNVSIYHEIPKCLIEILNTDFIESNYNFEIVDPDPLIVWHFDEISRDDNIEFAIKTISDSDCTDQSATFAVAKSLFIMQRDLHIMPYFTSDGSFRPGILASLLFIPLFVWLLIFFTSFTQTKNDKIRLAMFLDKVRLYKKYYKLSSEDIKKNLIKNGAEQHEIDEIYSKNLFKRFLIRFEIASEELILFLLIFINILDAFEILPGDFDYIKKIISWAILSYLFYNISITRVLFGKQNKYADITLLFAYFFLIIKNFITYATGAITQIVFFTDLITFTVKYSQIIETTFFIIGGILILLTTIYLTFKEEVTSPSVLSLLQVHLEKGKYLRRFILFYFALLLFFTTIYNLFFEWLAIAVDGPLVTGLIIAYIIMLIYKKEKFNFKEFLVKVGQVLNIFYEKVINLFTIKKYFSLGVFGLMILHLLTEIGNFILPYITGRGDTLYFGVNIVGFTRADFINLLETGFAPIFSINDFFYSAPQSIFTYQASLLNSWFDITLLLITYVANIIFVLFIMILPAFIWYHIYKFKNKKNTYGKVNLARPILALFLFTTFVFISYPSFTLSTQDIQSNNEDILASTELISGLTIITIPIDININFMVLIYALLFSLLAFIPGRFYKHALNSLVSMFVLSIFFIYIFLFFLNINNYFLSTITSSLAGEINFISGFILAMLSLIYLFTLIFYLGGLLLTLYELWNMHELPFEGFKEEIQEEIQQETQEKIKQKNEHIQINQIKEEVYEDISKDISKEN